MSTVEQKVRSFVSVAALAVLVVVAVELLLVLLSVRLQTKCDLLFKVEGVQYTRAGENDRAILSFAYMVEVPEGQQWNEGDLIRMENDCGLSSVKTTDDY